MDLWNTLIKPMLAYPSKPFNNKDWIFEIKFDGTRGISYIDTENKSVRMLNRRLVWFEYRYPEFSGLWKNVNAQKVILDGEVVVFENGKPNFYKLAEREHVDSKVRIELLSKTLPATYVVFDILYLDGKDLTSFPLEKRKEILSDTVKKSRNLLISKVVEEKGKEFYEAIVSQGLEGVMAKLKNSAYEIGKRSRNWLKIKKENTIDVVIIGYTTGTGEREEFGSLVAAAYVGSELKYVGKIGTGFSKNDIEKIKGMLKKLKTDRCPLKEEPELDLPENRKVIWVKPKLVCEVKFLELTKDLQMRAPVFLRIREDKEPEECVINLS